MPLKGAMAKIATQARLSAPSPNRRTSADTTRPTHQPITRTLAKNAIKDGPSENTQTS